MGSFSKALLKLRHDLGFKSAQAFYRHAEKLGAIEVNYPHYKKIETSLLLPKSQFVNRIAKAFPEYSAELVTAFCEDQFPDFKNLFGAGKATDIPPAPLDTEKRLLLYAPDELSPKQVATISESEWHYGLYQLLTLARRSVTLEELKDALPEMDSSVVRDLIQAKIAYEDERGVKAISVESRFPEASTPALKKAYAQMDAWDLELYQRSGFEKIYRYTLFRRVSPRYLPLIRSCAELLVNQVRSADESDVSRNENVVFLSLDIRSGKLPG